ncbi:hypothetical protein GDO78_016803 [Eleutherodactylus coqui]|uniref:Uncharacterized protein n=1 Tax=Eleutherodactylus coqui TaxID=57060 RepID=A0A8J6EK99_ELECQ|nr:hypothetical protein GDO78_016803 [Eleutherodactylus coqui]
MKAFIKQYGSKPENQRPWAVGGGLHSRQRAHGAPIPYLHSTNNHFDLTDSTREGERNKKILSGQRKKKQDQDCASREGKAKR